MAPNNESPLYLIISMNPVTRLDHLKKMYILSQVIDDSSKL